jgi:hypothetical protein
LRNRPVRRTCYARLSLVRPNSFDPDGEFAGFDFLPTSAGSCQVKLPDGEMVHVDLGETPGVSARLGEFNISGSNLRLVRLKPDGSSLCGMRILSVEGFVKLDSPGTVFIRRREPDEVLVTTGTGLTLSEGWLRGNSPTSRSDAR